jgi:hypothetical protein
MSLSAAQARRIKAVLTRKRLRVESTQDAFIDGLNYGLELLIDIKNLGPDDGRIELHVDAVERAAKALSKAIERADSTSKLEVRRAMEKHYGRKREWLDAVHADAAILADGCKKISAEKWKKKPGSKNGMTHEFIAQVANAYEAAFNKKPSAARSGPFDETLRAVRAEFCNFLPALKDAEIGQKAITPVLNRRKNSRLFVG